MHTTKNLAGLVLGAILFVIPGRWANAAELGAGAEGAVLGEASPGSAVAPPPPLAGHSSPYVVPPLAGYSSPGAPYLVLGGANFYRAVGRHDLAQAYRARQTMKTLVRVAGGVTLTAGLLWAAGRGFASSWCVTAGCHTEPREPVSYTGPQVTMGVGVAMVLLPAVVSTDPVSFSERQELARAAFRRENPLLPLSLNVAAAPAANGAGGNVVLSGRF